MSIEEFSRTVELVMVGAKAIELIKPLTDSTCSPDDHIEQQMSGVVEDLLIAKEQGPCGGVEMAEAVMDSLIDYRDSQQSETGQRVEIYANHPPSKGADRAKMYRQAGVVFGTPIEEVPVGSVYLFSAHGASPAEVEKAEQRGLKVVDTTCPLVGRIYNHIEKIAADSPGQEVGMVYLATSYDSDHPEVRGTRGVADKHRVRFIPITSKEEAAALAEGLAAGPEQQALSGLGKVGITGITTSNSDVTRELADVFESGLRHRGIDDGFLRPYRGSVCNTVKFRQDAARQMVSAHGVETIIIVGALGSNNTNELVGAVMDEAAKIEPDYLRLTRIIFANTSQDVPEVSGKVGIVSGASTQQLNIDQIIYKLNPASAYELGDTDKTSMFRPLGGPASAARLTLDANDFSWLSD